MALKEFTTRELQVMKKMIHTCCDLVDNACRVRENCLEFNSNTDYQSQLIDSKTDPETYYNFRWFDKWISIVADFWNYDNLTERKTKSNVWVYHINVRNCSIPLFDNKNSFHKLPYDVQNHYYGNFINFDVALCYYKRAIISFMIDNLGMKIQGDLFV